MLLGTVQNYPENPHTADIQTKKIKLETSV